jgi:hypothetical protein
MDDQEPIDFDLVIDDWVNGNRKDAMDGYLDLDADDQLAFIASVWCNGDEDAARNVHTGIVILERMLGARR